MKCKECPGYKVDGFAYCLIVFPMKPKQFVDENEDADYCRIWETYSVFDEEVIKQTEGCEKFE